MTSPTIAGLAPAGTDRPVPCDETPAGGDGSRKTGDGLLRRSRQGPRLAADSRHADRLRPTADRPRPAPGADRRSPAGHRRARRIEPHQCLSGRRWRHRQQPGVDARQRAQWRAQPAQPACRRPAEPGRQRCDRWCARQFGRDPGAVPPRGSRARAHPAGAGRALAGRRRSSGRTERAAGAGPAGRGHHPQRHLRVRRRTGCGGGQRAPGCAQRLHPRVGPGAPRAGRHAAADGAAAESGRGGCRRAGVRRPAGRHRRVRRRRPARGAHAGQCAGGGQRHWRTRRPRPRDRSRPSLVYRMPAARRCAGS